MIKNIIELTKDGLEFDGAFSFEEISKLNDSFAMAIHKTINEVYPEVFNMTEEEYAEIEPELQKWLTTDEALELHKGFQLEAQAAIAISAIKTMGRMTDDINLIMKSFNTLLLEGLRNKNAEDKQTIESKE